MNKVYHEILAVAVDAAREAGVKIREALSASTAPVETLKGKRDPVTETDLWVEQRLFSIISAKFPDHLLIGEESAGQLTKERDCTLSQLIMQPEYCWLIDPIDGTVNFANRIPQCSISIGVLHRGERVAAVVYEPYHGELFTAVRGDGAFRNGVSIQVSDRESLESSLVGTGFPYSREPYLAERMPLLTSMLRNFRDIRRLGSAALDLSWVACGRLDAYYEFGLKPWDVAAGSLIVEEAGGVVFNFAPKIEPTFSITASSYAAVNRKLDTAFRNLLIA